MPLNTLTTTIYLPLTTSYISLPNGRVATSIYYAPTPTTVTSIETVSILSLNSQAETTLSSTSNTPLSSATSSRAESITSTPTANGPSSADNSATVTPVPAARQSNKLGTSAIVGTVIGSIVVLAFLALAFFFIRRKRRRASARSLEFPELGDTGIIELDPESEKKRGELDGRGAVKTRELEGRNIEEIVPAIEYKVGKGTSELEAVEIKRKPNSKVTSESNRKTEVAGWETYEAQNSPNQGGGTLEIGNAHSEVQHPTQIATQVEQQALPPVTQGGGSGAVDEELLWLEQEESRMKESQARFQERKAQLLAQKRAGGGSDPLFSQRNPQA